MGRDRARHARGPRGRGAAPHVRRELDLLGSRRRRSALGYSLLALLAYVPPLLTAPGQGRRRHEAVPLPRSRRACSSRSASMWDPHIGMGTVTHQNIGYLFPMGPYYWLLDKLGVARLGRAAALARLAPVRRRARRALPAAHVRPARPGRRRRRARVHVHAVRRSTTRRGSRCSCMPWAALPWMIALIAQGAAREGLALSRDLRARRAGDRRRERDRADLRGRRPGAVDPVRVARRARGRLRAARSASRCAIGVLTLLTSLWWIVGPADAGHLRPRRPEVHARRSRRSRARRRPTRSCAASATGSSTARTGSGRGSRPRATTRSTRA